MLVAGHPVRTYRVLAHISAQPADFLKIPKSYLDLGLSAYAAYEWHCWLENDKLGICWHTVATTRKEAEHLMAQRAGDLEKLTSKFVTGSTKQQA